MIALLTFLELYFLPILSWNILCFTKKGFSFEDFLCISMLVFLRTRMPIKEKIYLFQNCRCVVDVFHSRRLSLRFSQRIWKLPFFSFFSADETLPYIVEFQVLPIGIRWATAATKNSLEVWRPSSGDFGYAGSIFYGLITCYLTRSCNRKDQ